MEAPTCGFFYLPSEVNQHIFSLCDAVSLLKIQRVCRLFFSLLQDDNFWKNRALENNLDSSKPVFRHRLVFRQAITTQSLGRLHKIDVDAPDYFYKSKPVSFLPAEKSIAIPLRGEEIKIFNLESKKSVKITNKDLGYRFYSRKANPIAYANRKIFFGHQKIIRTWDFENQKVESTPFTNEFGFDFLLHGNGFLFSECERKIKIWDLQNEKYLYTLENPDTDMSELHHLFYLDDEKKLIGGWRNGAITIWDPAKTNHHVTYSCLDNSTFITSLFTFYNNQIIFGLDNGKIQSLDLSSGKQFTILNLEDIKCWNNWKHSFLDVVYAEGKVIFTSKKKIKIIDPLNKICLDTLIAEKNIDRIVYQDGLLFTIVDRRNESFMEIWGFKKTHKS